MLQNAQLSIDCMLQRNAMPAQSVYRSLRTRSRHEPAVPPSPVFTEHLHEPFARKFSQNENLADCA